MNLPKLTRAFFNITDACNLRCRYCFVNWQNNFMSYEVAKDATDMLLNNAKENGALPDITFFGGEPLLLWDKVILPIAKYIREERQEPCALSITTNGTLLTKEIMLLMKKYNIGLLLSMDGEKETQDYNRPTASGMGSYDMVAWKLDMILEHFPNTTFRSTIIPPTCRNTWKNIQFAIDHGFRSFYTVPNVFEEWTEERRNVLAQEIHKYSEYYVDSYRNGVTPIKFSSMEEIMKRMRDINNAASAKQHRNVYYCTACGKCGLGAGGYCSVSTTGDLYSCQEMPSNEGKESLFYIGNIYDGVDDARRLALVESYDPLKAKGGDCFSCKYNNICDGGCVANNYLINGDIHVNAEMYCWWRQFLLSEAEWIVKTLGDEQNEMFRDYWVVINRGNR